MKKFLYKSLALLSILISIVCFLLLLEDNRLETNEYMAALTDKHHRINSIKKPKIILAGGSNLVFGIDSKKIEKELEIPVVNLGLHAKLGLNFIINELKDVARKGDIIVLSIEHEMTIDGNRELQKTTAYYNSFAYGYFQDVNSTFLNQSKMRFENCHLLFKKTISNIIDGVKEDKVYTRDGLNEYGDGMLHLDLPSKNVLGSKSIIKKNQDKRNELLNNFYRFGKENGIKVVFSYGAYEITEYEKNKIVLAENHLHLKNNLDMEMIMDIEDFVYPTSYFYDSVYHLNKTGRIHHTKKLIIQLKNSKTLK